MPHIGQEALEAVEIAFTEAPAIADRNAAAAIGGKGRVR